MKKHLLIMWSLLLCFATGAWAADGVSTLTFEGACGGSGTANDGVQWTITSDGNESNYEDTRGIHYGTSKAAVQYIRLTTSDITYPIKKIVVNASTANEVSATVSVTVGGEAFGGAAQTLTSEAAYYEFTGSASGEIVVNVTKPASAKKALYVKSVAVTYEVPAGAPMAPTISGKDSFVGSTSVTITNNEEGATVYYTVDKSDPTTSTTVQEYTAAFDISATTTVKAAAKKGDQWSSVATKTFTAIPSYANIEALTALESNATFGFTGELLVVAKPTAKYAYVKDATGATLIYDNSGTKLKNLEKGKTIAAPWTGKVSIYSQLFEAVPDAELNVKDGEAVEVTYPEVAAADVKAENVNKVVTLKGVTIGTVSDKNIAFSVGETPITGYNQFSVELPAETAGKTYDIVGAISRHNDDIQFQPITITKRYEIKIVNTDGLTITPDVTTAKAGEKVYASYVLADHYQLEFPDFVDDDDQPIEFTEGVTAGLDEVGGEMKMWFIMPEKNVTIKAKATKLYQLSMTQPENGTITVISVNMGSDPYSKAGKPIHMMVTANEGYVIKSVEVKDANDAAVAVGAESGFEYGQAYNYVFTMPASDVKIGATIQQKEPEDININPETGADISQALATASEGKNVRNITINLNAGEYTMSAPIVAGGNVVINGATGATIDASGITGSNKQFIVLNGTTEYVTKPDNTKDNAHLYIEKVDINNVTITGMPDGIIRDNQKTLLKNLTIDKCNIQVPNKVFVNFSSKGYVETLTVTNSTIWSADNAQFFVQYGSRLKAIDGAETAGWLQTIDVENSTFYHIAYGKNICDFPMNSQKCNVYTLKNNVFVDCGKSAGQVVVGFNKGGVSPNPVWTVSDNLFNYGGVDTSASEVSKAGKKNNADIVLQSVAGVVTFTDAPQGDFGGSVELSWGTEQPASLGDPRWTLVYTAKGLLTDGKYFVMGLSYDEPKQWLGGGKIGDFGTEFTATFDATAKTYTLQTADGKYLQADLTVGETAFGWTVDEDAVYGQNIYTIDGGVKKYIAVDENKNLVLTENAADPSIGWGFFPADYFWAAVAPRTIIGSTDLTGTAEAWQADAKNFMTRNELTGLWEKTYKLVEVTEEKKPEFKVALNGDATKAYPAEARVITLADFGTEAQAGIYNITISYNDEGNVVSVTGTKVEPEDIVINPADLGAVYGVMNLALDAALDGKLAKSITFNLGEGINYAVTKPLETGVNLTINGAAGAKIDASGITGSNKQFIVLNGTTEYVTKPDNTKDNAHLYIEKVDINNVTITGMPDGIIRDNQKTLLKNLTIDKCNIQVPNKVFVNFSSKGYVETLTVTNSTIWSADNAQFFVQYGSRLKAIDGAETAGWLQTIDVENSTFYHIAYGKNICDFPMNSQKCNVYTLKNNVFVDCGKSAGQVVVGFNKGGVSPNPVWTVSDNLFNYGGVDTSASEVSKAGQKEGADIVLQSVAGVVTFTDAAAGDFNGVVELPYGAAEPTSLGDGRWTLSYTHAPQKFAITKAAATNGSFTVKVGDAEVTEAAEGETVTITATPAENYEVDAITVKGADETTVEVSTGNTFTMPAQAVTVTVTFKVATGINTISADKAADALENAVIYNLAGQRVEKSQAKGGLYIVNGRKVVIK